MTTEEIILSKSWKELTETELDAVRELAADEVSFNHMKSFMQQVGRVASGELYEPSASVKSGLDAIFAKQHAGRMPQEPVFNAPSAKIVPLYQRNWTRIAAAAMFIGIAVLVWTWPGRQEIAPAAQIAKMDEPVVFSEWNPEKKQESASADSENTDNKRDQIAPAKKAEPIVVNLSNEWAAPAPMRSEDTYSAASYSIYDQAFSKNYEEVVYADSAASLKTGRDADLFPGSFNPASVAAAPENLLSYIRPAF